MKNGEAMKIDKGGIINDFIQPNRKQYVIPVYQRNYEWAEEHCTKLFEDIVGPMSRLLKKAKAIPLSLKNQQMTLQRIFTIQYALFQTEMVAISY